MRICWICGRWEGLDRFEARKRVLALIEARGLYDGADDNAHEVPHGDRSKVVIEPYLDRSVVRRRGHAGETGARGGEGWAHGEFVPKNWEKTYFNWLRGYPTLVRLAAALVGAPDSGVVWAGWPRILRVDGGGGPGRGEGALRQGGEADPRRGRVSTLGSPRRCGRSRRWAGRTRHRSCARYYKTDVLVTGFDIIFFWVARMMMTGLHFMKDEKGAPEVPFHSVYINSIVTDEQGKKMSKSVGNVLDPLDIIDGCELEELVAKRRAGVADPRRADAIEAETRKQFPKGIEPYGTDALRFALAALESQGQRALKLSMARVEGSRNFGTKLWNAARFCEMNECVHDPKFKPEKVEQTVNRWIVGETARLREACDAALESYRFNDYASALYTHTWNVFCDWYLEFAKPLLQGEDAAAKAETRATAAWALDQLLALMHPVSPFITEALWEATAGAEGRAQPLALGDWPDLSAKKLADPAADAEMGWVVSLIEAVRSVRAEMNVNPGAQVPLVLVGAGEEEAARLTRNASLASRLARLSDISFAETAPKGAVTVAIEGASVCLPLADVIDVKAEKARLEKAMAKVDKEAKGLVAKLGNESFLAKAPEEVVEEQRERLEAAEAEGARLKGALERLAEMA